MGEEEEAADIDLESSCDEPTSEATLMYRVESIAEVLQQTTRNLALFEKLLPAATRKESEQSPRGSLSFYFIDFIRQYEIPVLFSVPVPLYAGVQ
jgi:hypothetical protein